MTFSKDDAQICRSAIAWFLHDAQDQTVASFLRDISSKISASQDLTEKDGIVLCRVLQEYAQTLRGSRQIAVLSDADKADRAVRSIQASILSLHF